MLWPSMIIPVSIIKLNCYYLLVKIIFHAKLLFRINDCFHLLFSLNNLLQEAFLCQILIRHGTKYPPHPNPRGKCKHTVLPHVGPDIVRTDDSWEDWNMETLINNLQAWLRRNKPGDPPGTLREAPRRQRHWFAAKGSDQPRERAPPCCMYCKEDHWANDCTTLATVEVRRKFFHDNQLCYNCGRPGHPASKCRSRECYKCKGRQVSATRKATLY